MSLSDINIRERKFHNDLHASGQERSQNKFYKALYHLYSDFINILQVKTKSAEVLDYGCGHSGWWRNDDLAGGQCLKFSAKKPDVRGARIIYTFSSRNHAPYRRWGTGKNKVVW